MRIISGISRGTKLYTLDGENTRPTLDRVKEPLFSIIQAQIRDSIVLDLFAGSGALALEALSRGAKKATLNDQSKEAIQIIKKNIEKTHFEDKVELFCLDYIKCINNLKDKFDLIFIDPPYMKDIAVDAVKLLIEKDLLKDTGTIILETNDNIRELNQLEDISEIEVFDLRSYGKVNLLFLKRKERG